MIVNKDGLIRSERRPEMLIALKCAVEEEDEITIPFFSDKLDSRIILKSLFDKAVFPCYFIAGRIVYFNHYFIQNNELFAFLLFSNWNNKHLNILQ